MSRKHDSPSGARTQNPAAQGQSRDSLRCDDVLETCGHYIYYSSEGTTTTVGTRGDSYWLYKGLKSLLGLPRHQPKGARKRLCSSR
jgi:hypothetical protein